MGNSEVSRLFKGVIDFVNTVLANTYTGKKIGLVLNSKISDFLIELKTNPNLKVLKPPLPHEGSSGSPANAD
ncbi:hypothetical protein VULLAG_LOCUS2049 [Vulpes lagopus]